MPFSVVFVVWFKMYLPIRNIWFYPHTFIRFFYWSVFTEMRFMIYICFRGYVILNWKYWRAFNFCCVCNQWLKSEIYLRIYFIRFALICGLTILLHYVLCVHNFVTGYIGSRIGNGARKVFGMGLTLVYQVIWFVYSDLYQM